MPGPWHEKEMTVVKSFSGQLPSNLKRPLPFDSGNCNSSHSASPRHYKRHMTTRQEPTQCPPRARSEMSHLSLSIHRSPVTRDNLCYNLEHVEPLHSYADFVNGAVMRRTVSSSSNPSQRMGNGSLEHFNTPSMTITSDHYNGLVPYANWAKTPSFASGSEESLSVSSSFDFNDISKDEPVFDNLPLPFTTADPVTEKPPQFESSNVQFSNTHTSSLDQASQWLHWTTEPELSSQSCFLDNSIESQKWPIPQPLSSLAPFYGCAYPMPTTSGIPNNQIGMLIDEPPSADNHTLPHTHPRPSLIYSPQDFKPYFPQPIPRHPVHTQSESHPSSPTPSSDSPKSSAHWSDSRNALLIEWKRRGLSYKDIKRFGGFKEAESTLRGRFRTLTKAKEQRVRKPKWTETDVSYSRHNREGKG